MKGVERIALASLTRGLGMSREEAMEELVEVRRTIMDRNVHAYMPGYVFSVRMFAENERKEEGGSAVLC